METTTISMIVVIIILLLVGITFISLFIWQFTKDTTCSSPTCPSCSSPTCPSCPVCRNYVGIQGAETSSHKYMPIGVDGGTGGYVEHPNVANIDLCANICENDTNCRGFSYSNSLQKCVTKNGPPDKPKADWIYYEQIPK